MYPYVLGTGCRVKWTLWCRPVGYLRAFSSSFCGEDRGLVFHLRAFRVYHGCPRRVIGSPGKPPRGLECPGGLPVTPSGGGLQTGEKHAGLEKKPGPVVEAGATVERNEKMYSGSIGTTQKRREFFDEAFRFGLSSFFSHFFTLVSSRVSPFVF